MAQCGQGCQKGKTQSKKDLHASSTMLLRFFLRLSELSRLALLLLLAMVVRPSM